MPLKLFVNHFDNRELHTYVHMQLCVCSVLCHVVRTVLPSR
jgi:hypothetical protein